MASDSDRRGKEVLHKGAVIPQGQLEIGKDGQLVWTIHTSERIGECSYWGGVGKLMGSSGGSEGQRKDDQPRAKPT